MSARIGIDVRRATWAPQLGISRYARSLLLEMAGRAGDDLELVPLDLRGSPHWAELSSVALGGGHGFAARLVDEQLRMPLRARSLAALHLPWYEGPALPACPLIVNVHDLDTVDHPEGYRWRFRAYYNSLLRLYLRTAKAIIVPSRFTLDQLEDRWPGRPYVLIPYAVDAVFGPAGEAPDRDGPPSLLYTGGFGNRKRLGDLLDAFAAVISAEPAARLVVAGSAPEELRREAAARGLAGNADFTGFVSDAELAERYRRASLVVYPSMLEGFGFPVLEGMASGTPVVAARGGSVPEIAGDAALLVEPRQPADLAEAILSVLRDRGLAARLREAGLRRAGDFSWARCADETLAVYRDVVRRASNSA